MEIIGIIAVIATLLLVFAKRDNLFAKGSSKDDEDDFKTNDEE